jgi:DNA repair protein RecO (recombination protein O)
VLRHRKIGEADRVLTVFSADQGKFDVIAKGVRRPTSRKSGHLEELSHSSLLLAQGRSLDVVTQCEGIESLAGLRSNLEQLSAAFYISELVDRFAAERQENRAVFELMLCCLRGLDGGVSAGLTLRYFEIQLLGHTGFQPQLRVCASCRGPIDPVVNSFSPAAGGVVCRNCRVDEGMLRSLSVNALKVLRMLQTGSYADALRLRLTASLSAEVEGHLAGCLKHVLEREIRSGEFIRSLRSLSSPAASLSEEGTEIVVS